MVHSPTDGNTGAAFAFSTVNAIVFETDLPPAVTVNVMLRGPAWLYATSHTNRPVFVSSTAPAGRFAAENVTLSPSGSDPSRTITTRSPSRTVRAAERFSTGAESVGVTRMVNVCRTVFTPSVTVTMTPGYVPAASAPGVQMTDFDTGSKVANFVSVPWLPLPL